MGQYHIFGTSLCLPIAKTDVLIVYRLQWQPSSGMHQQRSCQHSVQPGQPMCCQGVKPTADISSFWPINFQPHSTRVWKRHYEQSLRTGWLVFIFRQSGRTLIFIHACRGMAYFHNSPLAQTVESK